MLITHSLVALQFWHYTIASAVAIIPGTVLYVYLGSLVSNISDLTSGEATKGTTLWVAIASGVIIIVVVVLITIYAKRAIAKKLHIPEEENVDGAADTVGDSAQKGDIENPSEEVRNDELNHDSMYERKNIADS